MNSRPNLAAFVLALFDLARFGLPADAERLAGRLGVEPAVALRALAELDRRGLADRARARLTLAGLGVAVGLDQERAAAHLAAAPSPAANHAPRHAA